jgi:hypothetical protein
MAVKKTPTNARGKEESNQKVLDQLKASINKRYDDIEHNFYLIGLDLIKVNMHVKNFRKWVKDNTRIDVSTAYTLMRLVKRDKELTDSKKYNNVRAKINLTKLIRMLKYPADFVDQLDFSKSYEAPGGKTFTLIDMPTDLFTEVISDEYKKLTLKDKGNDDEDNFAGVPMDKVIISNAKDKLMKLFSDLQTIFTVLSEVKVTDESREVLVDTITELESINSSAKHINSAVEKLVGALNKGSKK